MFAVPKISTIFLDVKFSETYSIHFAFYFQRNINGKKLESVVKKVINKMPYNSDTVSNPECLKCFTDLPELSGY